MGDKANLLLNWIGIKISAANRRGRPTINERELWWCHIGENIGEETNGKSLAYSRPVLILKKLTRNSFVGLPTTTAQKFGSWYVPIDLSGKKSNVMIHQVRIFDAKRLTTMLGRLDQKDFAEVKAKFVEFYS